MKRVAAERGVKIIVFFILLLFNGAFLRYLVRMLTIIPAFWLHSNRGLEMVFYHLVPDTIFTGWIRIILTTVLPFGLMVSFPARFFFGGIQWQLLLHIAAVTATLAGVVFLFWRRGLRAYSSASS